jgi:thiol-disulfide isomerase/thioredoxin
MGFRLCNGSERIHQHSMQKIMQKQLSTILLTILLSLAGTSALRAQEVKVIKLPELNALLSLPHDTLYVVNFWATWCGPCVKELPYFEQLRAEYADKPMKILLVSLDFRRELEAKVLPFIRKRNMQSEVLLLDETDYNKWIDNIDSSWEGNIPVTLIFNHYRELRQFVAKEVNYEQLKALVDPLLQ